MSSFQMRYFSILLLVSFGVGAFTFSPFPSEVSETGSNTGINPDGKTVGSRCQVPNGFERIPEHGGLVSYFRNLPVKPAGAKVLLHSGALKNRQDVHAAIISMEIGNKDLQQCADAVMRLRAEYLFQQKKFDAIHFNFTSGDKASFTKYAEGYRPVINGNHVTWQKKAAPDHSYTSFRKYMDLVFTYAGTASLEKELLPVSNIKDIKPGDVLIRGGFPGHAVLVMDVAVNKKTGEKIFLLSQSYMPAQEIHIIKNPENQNLSPWYSAKAGNINTPEWAFTSADLKRFSSW